MAKVHSPATFAAGLITAGAGLYFVVVGVRLAGAAPALGLLVVCAGLAFGLSGIRIAAQGLTDTEDAAPGALASEAPAPEAPAPEAPAPLHLLMSLAPIGIVFWLAVLATWMAFAGDGTLARIAFAFGALVAWGYFIMLARRSLETLQPDVPVMRALRPPAGVGAASLRHKIFGRARRPGAASQWRAPVRPRRHARSPIEIRWQRSALAGRRRSA